MKLLINNSIFSNFSSYVINLIYNSVASSFRFDILRDISPVPLSYADCQILNDKDELLLTGTIVNHTTTTSAKPNLIVISGYSKAGILEDCNIPVSAYPLQFDNLSLKQIIDKLLPIFDIEYIVDSIISNELNKTYKKSNANISSSIKEYINNLASQRGIIISHDKEGKIVFTKVDTSNMLPVATFEEGNTGTEKYSININGQVLHSEISVIKQASSIDKSSGEFTIKNLLVDKYRPKVIVSTSGSVFDVEKMAIIELSKEFANIKIMIDTTLFVIPGNLIQLKVPSLRINDFIELFVERTTINGDMTGERYTLTCVLKEVYSMEKIQNIFT